VAGFAIAATPYNNLKIALGKGDRG
jgi:hypothetical protein